MVVCGTGTGGTLTGLSRKMKERNPKCIVSNSKRLSFSFLFYIFSKVSFNGIKCVLLINKSPIPTEQ